MPKTTHPWTRFWCDRGGRISLVDGGYLADPEENYGRILNPSVVPFDAIGKTPCLVLLGEPGIGKTHTMRAHRETTKAQLAPNERLLAIEFPYDSEEQLFGAPSFRGWLEGESALCLFIDGLDECPAPDFPVRLLGRLRSAPVDGLRLRIACRTAELPRVIEEELPELWSRPVENEQRHKERAKESNNVGFYELAPLREKDVALAAGKDAEAFLAEVARKGAQPLAIKPITLEFLLNVYRREGALPSTRTELYLKGCLALCDEQSKTRSDLKRKGKLDPRQRMAVAARIAAVSILSHRGAVFRGTDLGDVLDDTVLEHELNGGTERVGGEELKVGRDEVEEALTVTGLFTSRGPRLLGWAHQTYAEFLAARFLYERGLSADDLTGVLTHSAEPTKVVPQLRETAAWLASMDPDVFRRIARDDPKILLRSDMALADDASRERIVASILQLIEAREMFDTDPFLRSGYEKLLHGGLAAQLEPYIGDRSKYFMTRRAAIDIAKACHVQALLDPLIDIALDPNDNTHIREQAAHAVVTFGSPAPLPRLKPLALGRAGEDPDDTLKGHALTALWPKYITAKEVFSCLTPPKRTHLFGSYNAFLSDGLTKGLSDDDLLEAFDWVQQISTMGSTSPVFSQDVSNKELEGRWQGSIADPLSPLSGLIDTLLRRAWEQIDSNPPVLVAFTKIVRARLNRDDTVFDEYRWEQPNPLKGNDGRRRRLVESLVTSTPELKSEPSSLFHNSLISPADILWLIEHLEQSGHAPSEQRRRWARLIARTWLWDSDAEINDAVVSAAQMHTELKEELSGVMEPVELGSERAEKMKALWEENEQWRKEQEERDRPALVISQPEERVRECLEKFEAGNVDCFPQLQLEMTLEPTSIYYGDYFGQVSQCPGWKRADEATKRRILEASKRFLLACGATPPDWLNSDEYPLAALAGYKALRLLMEQASDWIDSLQAAVWRRWAPIIIGYPTAAAASAEAAAHHHLIALAYQSAPEEVLWALGALIYKENLRHNHVFIVRELAACWDERLGALLLMMAQDPALKPSFFGSLLDELLDRRVPGARDYAASLLSLPLPTDPGVRKRAHAAAHALLAHAEDAGWPVIWPVLQQDAAFGREVFLTTAPQIERSSAAWSLRLSEDAAADAYIWLETQFPQSKDKEEGRFSGVTPRETVAELRDSLRSNLAMRGTRAAQAAIERIGQVFPNHDVISFARINAKEATLQGTWVPLSPGKVLALWPKPGRGSLRPTSAAAPVTVFLSYAPADMDLAKALSDDHLALLKRQGIIRAWHEGLVEPGHEWEEETRRHLEESAMILLLISAKFNASDRCYVDHLDSAMRRHDAGQARVIPILLKSCDWTGAPYGKLEPLPRNRKPVTAWRDRNEALAAVAGELRSLLEKHSNDAEG